jgi:hypothetical protein
MDANSKRAPNWPTAVFDELAAFRDRVFAKVGERPHAHQEKVDWSTFNCAECIEWQKRYDAAFRNSKRTRGSPGSCWGREKRKSWTDTRTEPAAWMQKPQKEEEVCPFPLFHFPFSTFHLPLLYRGSLWQTE